MTRAESREVEKGDGGWGEGENGAGGWGIVGVERKSRKATRFEQQGRISGADLRFQFFAPPLCMA